MTFLLIIIKFITHSLHFILSSPSPIDALDKLEVLHFDIMFQFYKKLGLKKSRLSAGGKFNGPAVKTNLKEENLQLLSSMLPTDK